jgi:hypothetical protein
MVAYAAAMARGDIEAIALGAPTGPFGHIYRPADFIQPYFDGLDRPAIYPGFHVISGLARLSGAPLLDTRISDGGAIAALAADDAGTVVLWLANLTPRETAVEIPATAEGNSRAVLLDADTFEQLTSDPDFLEAAERPMSGSALTLDAYAVARIRIG